jgi:prepilin signal peptidase PulO-like enzyme (type II secretory pathway)
MALRTPIPRFDHIVVVIEENHAFGEVIGNAQAGYFNSLAATGALLTNYHGITHPSQPNYFALYAGSTFGADNAPHREPDPTLATILQANGETFAGYVEAGSPARHNPWESFPEGFSVERSFAVFPTDLSALPDVAFVVPNLVHDMHDGTVAQADQWLRTNLGAYAAWAPTHNSLLVVVWDEDDASAGNQVPLILDGANVLPGTYGGAYTHYDLLSTILATSGLSGPNEAAHAPGFGSAVFFPPTDGGFYGDFGGDRRGDVFLHARSGAVALWQLNGAQVLSADVIGAVGAEWHVESTGDFGGDGRSDVLWRADGGAVMMWQMAAARIQSAPIIGSVGAEWHVAGTGDFNGDGAADILWRNDGGVVMLWQMAGARIQSAATVGSVGNEWHVVGVGDFDGDGRSDLLWRSDAGAVMEFQMNGPAIRSAPAVGSVGREWHVVGIGDFDGDGMSDVLWRNDGGTLLTFFMNGSQIRSAPTIGARTSDWHVDGTGDFDGDGRADILWRNDNGTVDVWTINGAQVTATATISPLGTDWSPGLHDYDYV